MTGVAVDMARSEGDQGVGSDAEARAQHLVNAVAPRFDVEPFDVFAHAELEAAPLSPDGVCFNPACQRRFAPSRAWQVYCCPACAAIGKAEMRKWGNRMALPLLLHRVGKYERDDTAILDRTRAARRYVTQVQSQWLAYRRELARRASG